MKKFWYSAFAAALVLTGCQKELEENPTVNEGQTISFIAEPSVETKSLMTIEESKVKYFWTDEDTDFHVFYGETETDKPVTSSRTGQTLSLTAHFADGVLPATGNVNFTGYLNGSVKASQTMDAEHTSYDPTADVMIAKASVPASELSNPVLFQFKRMVSIAKFTLNDLPGVPSSVTISADQPILGSWDQKGTFASAEGDITVTGMSSNVVYVACAPVSSASLTITAQVGGEIFTGTIAEFTLTAGNVRGKKVAMKAVPVKATLDFTSIDLSSWTNSYIPHSIEYAGIGTVTFAQASKQTTTITNQPVTKGSSIEVLMEDGKYIHSLTLKCTQWGTKPQTITLSTSTDGGKNYEKTDFTSSTFRLNADNLKSVNAIQFTFSSTSNQIGITSLDLVYSSAESGDDSGSTIDPGSDPSHGESAPSISSYKDGVYYIIDSYEDKFFAMSGEIGNNSIAAVDVTAAVIVNADGSISIDEYNASITVDMKYSIEKTGGSYNLKSSQGNSIYLLSGGNNLGNNSSINWTGFEKSSESDFRYSLTATGTNSNKNTTNNCLLLQTTKWDATSQMQKPTLTFKGYAQSNRGQVTEKAQCYATGYMFFVPAE